MRSEGSGWRLDQKRTRMWRVWNVALIQQMMKLLSHCSVFWNQNQSVRSSERFVRNVVFMRWHDRALCCWPCRTRVHLSFPVIQKGMSWRVTQSEAGERDNGQRPVHITTVIVWSRSMSPTFIHQVQIFIWSQNQGCFSFLLFFLV